jgi:outer membrane protein TolC
MTGKKIIITLLLILPAWLQAQDAAVTLEYCLQKARENHPLADQSDFLSASSALKLKNLNRNYLPEININGDIHYQSDVTAVPVKIEQFAPEPLDKDWYKITLDVSQIIYDGSITKRSKDVENLDNQIGLQNTEIEVYRIKERVTAAFFNILTMQENKSLLELYRSTLESRLKEVESAVRNGAALASNADILRAEILKTGQRIDETEIAIESSYKILSLLVGEEIASGTPLDMSSPEIPALPGAGNRPEYGLFSLQEQKTISMKKVSSSRLMPKLIAYGQAGYGRPGFDMLKNEFDDFYIVGAKLSWNVWNWNKTSNERTILDLNRNIIASNRDAFSQNVSIELERRRAEIVRYDKLIEKDEQIAALRKQVAETYASRLRNGVITSTEYITELNAEAEALLNLKIHKVQLVRARYEYLAAAGKL